MGIGAKRKQVDESEKPVSFTSSLTEDEIVKVCEMFPAKSVAASVRLAIKSVLKQNQLQLFE